MWEIVDWIIWFGIRDIAGLFDEDSDEPYIQRISATIKAQ